MIAQFSHGRDLVYNCYDSLTLLIGQNDASKILSSDAACPICDQVLSKRLVLSSITSSSAVQFT